MWVEIPLAMLILTDWTRLSGRPPLAVASFMTDLEMAIGEVAIGVAA